MIITQDFVFIHIPKNGGSFVEKILRAMYGRRSMNAEGSLSRRADKLITRFRDKKPYCYFGAGFQSAYKGYAEILYHGYASEIPKSCAGKPVLAVIRDPLDRAISQYEYKWWEWSGQHHPNEKAIQSVYPSWPNVASFAEYIDIQEKYFTCYQSAIPYSNRVGYQTETLIRFLCRNPRKLLSMGRDKLTINHVLEDMPTTHFLCQGRLNTDLHSFLLSNSIRPDLASIAIHEKPVLPNGRGRKEHSNFSTYYDEGLMSSSRERNSIACQLYSDILDKNHTSQTLFNAHC